VLQSPFPSNRHPILPSPKRKEFTLDLTSVAKSKRRVTERVATADSLTFAAPGPTCFRISGVPADWNENVY
jgi:hypothetical protein